MLKQEYLSAEGEPTAAASENPMLEEGPEGDHQQAAEVLQQQQGGAVAGASKSAQLQALQPAQAEAEEVTEPQVRQQNMPLLLPGKRTGELQDE